MAYMYHNIAQGVKEDGGTNNYMTWWKTNFNMPVPNLWSGSWVEGRGPVMFYGAGTSFNLSGFLPGWELVAFFCGWHWDGPVSGTTYLYSQWLDSVGSVMWYCANGLSVNLNLAADYWQEHMYACNQGVAGWEVDVSGTYKCRSWSTGVQAMGNQDTSVTFSNVPSTTQMSSTYTGGVWVEGNDLCYVCGNRWKHNMEGDSQGYVGTTYSGAIWIDTSYYLHWVGADGNNYRAKWRIKQFASTWTNGPTGETYAGATYSGSIWVDTEFGYTHLAYIAGDGYKYLAGSGHYPYQTPY